MLRSWGAVRGAVAAAAVRPRWVSSVSVARLGMVNGNQIKPRDLIRFNDRIWEVRCSMYLPALQHAQLLPPLALCLAGQVCRRCTHGKGRRLRAGA